MKKLLVLVSMCLFLFVGCSDDSLVIMDQFEQEKTKQYDFDTPEEYMQAYVDKYLLMSENLSSNCVESPGRFSDEFKTQSESLLLRSEAHVDGPLDDDNLLDDLEKHLASICVPNPRDEVLMNIVAEMVEKFPHLNAMNQDEWMTFAVDACADKAKAFKQLGDCETDYALELASLSGLYVAMMASCAATGPFAVACGVGVSVWYAAGALDANMTYNDCVEAQLYNG